MAVFAINPIFHLLLSNSANSHAFSQIFCSLKVCAVVLQHGCRSTVVECSLSVLRFIVSLYLSAKCIYQCSLCVSAHLEQFCLPLHSPPFYYFSVKFSSFLRPSLLLIFSPFLLAQSFFPFCIVCMVAVLVINVDVILLL